METLISLFNIKNSPMKYIYKKFYLQGVALIIMLISVVACTTMDEGYNEFLKGGEISYTGKIDSLEIFSGKNRVNVKGLFISDPKITECRVFWNSGADSIVIPINRTEGVDTLDIIINDLEENIYSFDVRTYDALGNKSIGVSSIGTAYGARYQASLTQRPVISHDLPNEDLIINYASMDLSSGVFGTEVNYTDVNDEQNTIIVPIDSTIAVLDNFKPGSIYTYRTLFLPDETSIDTFSTDFEEVKPLIAPALGNAAVPFLASATSGRWGILAEPWITNEAAKNHSGYGGWDQWNSNIFNMESGWGAPPIINGKIYQVVTADPATYQLKVTIRDTNHDAAAGRGSYFVIAKGDGLPDFENVETATEVLGYKSILQSSPLEYYVTFTVDETTNISVGQVTMQPEGFNRFCNIKSWEIIIVN